MFHQVDEVYNIMGTKSRATVLICFLLSLFGEMFAPFGIIAPLLQVSFETRWGVWNLLASRSCNDKRG